MRKLLYAAVAGLVIAALGAPAMAGISLDFVPGSQSVGVGSSADVAIVVSGLGVGSAPSLGVFDFDVSYDSSIVGLSTVVFGDPVLGDQLDLMGFGPFTSVSSVGPGTDELSELSFDLPAVLDAFQADSFTLATLSFDALALGTSGLEISTIHAFGDSGGAPLSATTGLGELKVVPAPPALILGVIGLGLAGVLRRIRAI